MSEATLLRVVDLACARGGVRVLEGVSLVLRPGQARAVTGPNGVGKTTFLRCVAGLQVPEAGSVVAPPEGVAYAAHADGVKAVLTVAENLGFWAAVYGAGGDVAGAMAALNLTALADRPAAQLSAGQRRRLGLARLPVSGRRLWVLDEPTVSLDAASVELVAGMIRAHLAGGGAALIATHADLGLPEAEGLDLTAFRARAGLPVAFAGDFA